MITIGKAKGFWYLENEEHGVYETADTLRDIITIVQDKGYSKYKVNWQI